MSGEANMNIGPALASLEGRRSLREVLGAPEVRDWLIGEKLAERRNRKLIDAFLQAIILVLSLAAIYLLTSPGPYARWGHVVGLASQPFWLAATWRARQWGMFVLAIAYSGLWLRGIASYF
jgi:hypothetical protein